MSLPSEISLPVSSSREIMDAISYVTTSVANELDSVELPGTTQEIEFIVTHIKKLLYCADNLLHALPTETVNRIAHFHSDGADLVLSLRNGITACDELTTPEGSVRMLLAKLNAEGFDEYHFSQVMDVAAQQLSNKVNQKSRLYQDAFIRRHGSMDDQPLFEDVFDHVAGCVKTLVEQANFGGIESQAKFLISICEFGESDLRNMLSNVS